VQVESPGTLERHAYEPERSANWAIPQPCHRPVSPVVETGRDDLWRNHPANRPDLIEQTRDEGCVLSGMSEPNVEHRRGLYRSAKMEPMPVQVTVVNHPVAAEALTHLRDQNTSNQFFRAEMRRLSLIVIAEATKDVPTHKIRVTTPLAETDGSKISNRPVLVPILRAGLGMLPAAMELLPDADIAVIGVQRDEHTHEPSEYVAKLPHNLAGRHCVVLDPMLATGGSLEHGCRILAKRGAPQPITIACVLAAPEGIAHLEKSDMNLHIVTASVDERLNENAFIVPGLGDAGDRQFGPPN